MRRPCTELCTVDLFSSLAAMALSKRSCEILSKVIAATVRFQRATTFGGWVWADVRPRKIAGGAASQRRSRAILFRKAPRSWLRWGVWANWVWSLSQTMSAKCYQFTHGDGVVLESAWLNLKSTNYENKTNLPPDHGDRKRVELFNHV
jgi:hypothetical protein